MGEPYHATIRGSSGGSLIGLLRCVDRLGNVVDHSSRRFGLHVGVEASFHLHAVTIPTTCGGWHQLQFLGGRLVWSQELLGHTSTITRPSTRPQGHDADSVGRRLVPLLAQDPLGPAIHGPPCLAYSSRPTSAVGEGSRRLGVVWRPLLRSHRLPSHSSFGEYFGLAYAPQMLSSPLEVPNLAEHKAIQMVAHSSEANDVIPPVKVLLERLGGVSSMCRSSRRLLPSLFRVSVRTDDMAGNTDKWSGPVHSRLILALH